MKPSLIFAAAVLVIVAGFAHAGDAKSVDERIAALEARMARLEARLDAASSVAAPQPAGAPASLTTNQRTALVVVAKMLNFYRDGKAVDLPGAASLSFFELLTPEQTVAIQEVEAGLDRGAFGVTWEGLRERVARIAMDLNVRWATEWRAELKRGVVPEDKAMLDAARDVATVLEQGNLAGLPTAYAAWEKASGTK